MSAEGLPAGVWACPHCKAHVVVRQIRDGRRWPFDRALLAAEDIAEDLRYVPMRAGHGIVMVPAADINERRLSGIRWFANRHTCVQWMLARRAKAAAAQDVDALGDALAQIFSGSPAAFRG